MHKTVIANIPVMTRTGSFALSVPGRSTPGPRFLGISARFFASDIDALPLGSTAAGTGTRSGGRKSKDRANPALPLGLRRTTDSRCQGAKVPEWQGAEGPLAPWHFGT